MFFVQEGDGKFLMSCVDRFILYLSDLCFVLGPTTVNGTVRAEA